MKRALTYAACAVFICGTASARTRVAITTELGIASYYQNPHYSGLVAAHKTLPLGTRVKVVNLANGRRAILKIVDRGPFIRGRVIDVSPAAARALGFHGLAHVRIERI
jgi:rare lipoprotein A